MSCPGLPYLIGIGNFTVEQGHVLAMDKIPPRRGCEKKGYDLLNDGKGKRLFIPDPEETHGIESRELDDPDPSG